MGFIDADAHVWESEDTWSYLTSGERRWKPVLQTTDGEQHEWRGLKHFWYVDGQLLPSGRDAAPDAPPEHDRTLADPRARIAAMDRHGIETQVVISTFFLGADIRQAEAQVALARSCNRWLADRCRASNGRLRWSIVPPLRDIAATIEEFIMVQRTALSRSWCAASKLDGF